MALERFARQLPLLQWKTTPLLEVFFPFFEKKTEPGQALEWNHLPWDTAQRLQLLQPHLDPFTQFLYCKSNPWEDTGQTQTPKTLHLLQAYIKIIL